MNAERLLALYDRVAEAPDAVVRLRRFVLSLAVRGKLVEQDPADEPASELLKRTEAEKARLVKAGKIRKPKALPPNDPGLWPFVLPSLWVWSRIDELSPRSLTDGDWIETKDQSTDGGIRLIQLADVGVGSFLNKSLRFITHETEVRLKCTRLSVGDILIARLPNPIGRACIFPDIGQPAITAVDVAILRSGATVSAEYLVAALNAPATREQIEAYGKGATRFRVSTGHLKSVLIPLPPLAEQHRIVAKVDELMALCDRLEEVRTAREETRDRLTAASLARLSAPDADDGAFRAHARFAVDVLPALTARADQVKHLRQTILNLAVRGKLVEQDPRDEPAEELLATILAQPWATKRKPVAEPDEFAITGQNVRLPASWVWGTVDSLVRPNETVTYGILKPVWTDDGVPTVRVTEMKTGEIDVATLPRCEPARASKFAKTTLSPGDLLISKDGTIGKTAFVPPELDGGNITQHVLRFPITELLDRRFIKLAIDAPFSQAWMAGETKGVALKGVNVGDFRRMPIPLPPLAEQHRIVAKVDGLMALCDRLETSLGTAGTSRKRLLESLIHDALLPKDAGALSAGSALQ